MIDTEKLEIRPLAEHDLAQVLCWRNHPDVRSYMYSQHLITPEEHVAWFQRCQNSAEHHPLIVEYNQTPFGFVNFTKHSHHKIADWGFYLAPDAQKGMGQALGETALNYAFNQLKLNKVCGEALSFNEKSIRFHLKMGFQQEGRLRAQFFDAQQTQFHDILCFGLLASEWSTKHPTLEHLA